MTTKNVKRLIGVFIIQTTYNQTALKYKTNKYIYKMYIMIKNDVVNNNKQL